eukprot:710536-Amphidinium_carterae.1
MRKIASRRSSQGLIRFSPTRHACASFEIEQGGEHEVSRVWQEIAKTIEGTSTGRGGKESPPITRATPEPRKITQGQYSCGDKLAQLVVLVFVQQGIATSFREFSNETFKTMSQEISS